MGQSAIMAFFMGKCMEFAKIDIFSGELIYDLIFNFEESEPLNGSYEQLGFETKNFMFNSGSYFIFVIIIGLSFIYSKVVHHFAMKYPHNEFLRNKAI